jgi:hypothetical protein
LATLAATAVFAVVAAAAASGAGATVVSLRVESAEAPAPLFDGTVSTQPHPVDGGDGSGAHPCAGAPGADAAATATGALDDAMREARISWRGKWDPSFRDFFIDRIGPYASAAPDRYWSLTVNGKFSAGGCLTQIAAGDSIRFFYGPLFGAAPGETPQGPGSSAGGNGSEGDHGEAAVGRRPRGLRRIATSANRFLRTHRGAGEEWAELVLSVRAGGSPALAARRLLAERLGSQARNGSFGAEVNATALAVLALRDERPRAAARAAAWLVAVQSTAGGFGYRPGAPADVDTTGLTSWALAVEKKSAALQRAVDFIRSTQAPDGGFPALPGGASNAQSTGLAVIALRVSGAGPLRTFAGTGLGPLDRLAALARPNGSIAYARRSAPTPLWTTSQALLGLTSKAKLLGWDGNVASG